MQRNSLLKSINSVVSCGIFIHTVFAMQTLFILLLTLTVTVGEGFVQETWADKAELDQVIRFTSSPNPVGSGARALGMGGAFIAICDDATAASWNPAGLVQLEKPELSVVYDYHKNDLKSHYTKFPDADVSDGGDDHSFNYLSAAYPFTLFSRNMTASINYQHLYDFKNNSSRISEEVTSSATFIDQSSYSLDGALWALSPAFSFQITPTFSVGITLNIWEDGIFDNEWQTHYSSSFYYKSFKTNEAQKISATYSETYAFSGMNYHLGALWNISSSMAIGLVFKAPFTADLDYHYHSESDLSGSIEYDDDPLNIDPDEPDIYDKYANETLDMPMSFGLGISFRLSDAFSVALDCYKTWWEDYRLHTHSGEVISPISGELDSLSSVGNTTQIRLGAEYLWIKEKFVVPIRVGLFYDPEPSIDGTIDFWGGALGGGLIFKNVAFDVAFQYRMGSDVVTTFAEEKLIQDKESYTVYSSLIYYF